MVRHILKILQQIMNSRLKFDITSLALQVDSLIEISQFFSLIIGKEFWLKKRDDVYYNHKEINIEAAITLSD